MKTLLCLISLCISHLSFAQDSCWQNEIHPINVTPYTQAEWENAITQWQTQKPSAPLITDLFKAHKTYKNELSTAQKLGNDKRKHCYIGCRIAQDTSLEVATYVGWMKELEDLQDCDKNTFFEPLDMQATTDGALASTNLTSQKGCYKYCKTTYVIPKNSSALNF